MSKSFKQFRMAVAGLIALLQLILLPATHVLHLGCQHSHSDGQIASTSDPEAAEGTCASFHCCSHCSHRAADNNPPAGSGPIEPPHDEDSCQVCQTVFAAQVATTAPVDLTTVERVFEYLTLDSQAVYSTPRYSVLSRGPPASLLG